jgi:hypothetical protein
MWRFGMRRQRNDKTSPFDQYGFDSTGHDSEGYHYSEYDDADEWRAIYEKPVRARGFWRTYFPWLFPEPQVRRKPEQKGFKDLLDQMNHPGSLLSREGGTTFRPRSKTASKQVVDYDREPGAKKSNGRPSATRFIAIGVVGVVVLFFAFVVIPNLGKGTAIQPPGSGHTQSAQVTRIPTARPTPPPTATPIPKAGCANFLRQVNYIPQSGYFTLGTNYLVTPPVEVELQNCGTEKWPQGPFTVNWADPTGAASFSLDIPAVEPGQSTIIKLPLRTGPTPGQFTITYTFTQLKSGGQPLLVQLTFNLVSTP